MEKFLYRVGIKREEVDCFKTVLKKLREIINGVGKSGVRCPVCDQYARINSYNLTNRMLGSLMILYEHFDKTKYHHKDDISTKALEVLGKQAMSSAVSGEFAKMKHWGLIEEAEKDENKDSRTSGMWRITKRGGDFVEGKIQVPSYIHIYNSTLYGFSGKMVYAVECCKNKFSYKELLNKVAIQ